MSPVSLLRFGLKLFRARAFRVFLGLAALLWLFDRFIWLATQRSFFASVGLESWFWRGLWADAQLFAAFLALCLVLTRGGLGQFAPHWDATENAPHLPGILARFAPLRARIYHVSNALALVLALVLARDFARHGPEWILLRHGGRVGFGYLGFDAALWTLFLPLWMPFLLGIWKFSLALGFLVAVTGVLNALPVLAAHNTPPPALTRVLWRTGALLLGIRALLYGFQFFDLPRGAPLSSGDAFVLAPIFAVGSLWCAFLAARFALRTRRKTASFSVSEKPSRAIILALAALFLPAWAGVLSWPLRAILPETAGLKSERERATRAAWCLPAPETAPVAQGNGASIERNWPVWDAASLLALRPRAAFQNGRVVAWKSATLDFANGHWSAILVGEGAGSAAWNANREAEKSNALALERVDWRAPGADGLPQSSALAIEDAFFGIEGRSIFGKSGGISLQSPFTKWAWAWRFRDLLLPVDAQNSPHLLTFRGARERAQILVPFLTVVGEPRLVLDNQDLLWKLELRALSPHFPGAMRGLSGQFAGANSVSSPLQMRLDARSGRVSFVASPGEINDVWRAAYPEIALENAPSDENAGETLGRAQMEILAALDEQERTIYGAARALNARGAASWRVLSVRKTEFELLEGAAPRPLLTRVAGDLGARLSAIDAAIAKTRSASPSIETQAGEPFVWRDARAPGGFWVGRAFFALAPAENNAPGGEARGPILWRVALTGIDAKSRVGVGQSAREAELDFSLILSGQTTRPRAEVAAPLNSHLLFPAQPRPPGEANELEVAALQTHRALQDAARRGDWKQFGALTARQNALLERLVAQRKLAPKNH